jgi:hypothetical protein
MEENSLTLLDLRSSQGLSRANIQTIRNQKITLTSAAKDQIYNDKAKAARLPEKDAGVWTPIGRYRPGPLIGGKDPFGWMADVSAMFRLEGDYVIQHNLDGSETAIPLDSSVCVIEGEARQIREDTYHLIIGIGDIWIIQLADPTDAIQFVRMWNTRKIAGDTQEVYEHWQLGTANGPMQMDDPYRIIRLHWGIQEE